MSKIRNIVLYLLLTICLFFLVTGKPGIYTAPSSLYLWDLGHILMFTLASVIMIKKLRYFNGLSYSSQLLFALLFGLITGVFIELAQIGFERTPDAKDLIRDVLGALTGVAYFSPKRFEVPLYFRKSVQFILLILILFEIYPFSRALYYEAKAISQIMDNSKESGCRVLNVVPEQPRDNKEPVEYHQKRAHSGLLNYPNFYC